MVLPQPDGTLYVGLTDEPVEGDIPDVPEPSEPEIGFLLDVVSAAFAQDAAPLATWSARTPACARCSTVDAEGAGSTADLSRRHAVLTSRTGVVTVVGGKLTTYRQMAEDAVDAAVAEPGSPPARAAPAPLPLLGAAPRAELARLEQPPRLVRRFGTEAALVLDNARAVTRPRATTSCSPRRRPGARHPRRAASSGSPTRAPPTSPTCSTGVPGSAWSPPTASCRARRRARPPLVRQRADSNTRNCLPTGSLRAKCTIHW